VECDQLFSDMKSRPPHTFVVKPIEGNDISKVISLIAELDEFFPEDSIPIIEFSLKEHRAIVGLLGDEIIGFITYELRDDATAEILWMGVKKNYHGLGLGTMMLESLERMFRDQGISHVVATTLSYTVKYKPYEKVRTFFYHRGFKARAIQSNYYEDGVDRLILIKDL